MIYFQLCENKVISIKYLCVKVHNLFCFSLTVQNILVNYESKLVTLSTAQFIGTYVPWMVVCGLLLAGIAGSNPDAGVDVCLL